MDVVFHEDSMYFSFESELQEEYHKEIQTLDYDYHIFKEDEYEQSELVNQEAGELDMSGTTLEPSSKWPPRNWRSNRRRKRQYNWIITTIWTI